MPDDVVARGEAAVNAFVARTAWEDWRNDRANGGLERVDDSWEVTEE